MKHVFLNGKRVVEKGNTYNRNYYVLEDNTRVDSKTIVTMEMECLGCQSMIPITNMSHLYARLHKQVKCKKCRTVDFSDVLSRYLSNETVIDIAKSKQCDTSVIYKYLNRNNIYVQNNDIPIGYKFNEITVLKKTDKRQNDKVLWECECSCGTTLELTTGTINTGTIGSCGCQRKSGNQHKNWKGFGEIHGSMWYYIYFDAERRNLEFTITIEQAWDLFLAQNRKCALSGLDLIITPKRKDFKENTASLDRIDSSKGYINGNIQWVHRMVNQMKWNYNEQEFIDMCKIIAKNN